MTENLPLMQLFPFKTHNNKKQTNKPHKTP